MISLGLFEAKLEASEMRMDAKLCTLFEEFRLDQSPSPRRSQHGYSLISGYFHDFTEERTMMLKVFLDDDLESTAHDHKKEQEKGIHMTPIAMMPSISMLALPGRGNVFVLGADTSRVGIDITLMQDS
ncbi:hypothetical protein B296_00033484 [Ensete ventricosum]|uniref:Uncharacterized protein n=1 Tax=Ensete ventricosum TaxID=4639 RepID=A0A426XKE0_ENSVE|nr:hypothetical protein B296_00033484 [Ensete ventricosum]